MHLSSLLVYMILYLRALHIPKCFNVNFFKRNHRVFLVYIYGWTSGRSVVQIPYSSKCFYVNLFKRHGHEMRPYNAHAYAIFHYPCPTVYVHDRYGSSSYGLLC